MAAGGAVTPARLREIADTLPGYVCGQLLTHADAWERDLADVERFRKLARGYMDERDEARREVDRLAEWLDVAAAAENANAKELSGLRDLIAQHGPVGAGNEADTIVEMKRLAFLAGLEAAAALCEAKADEGGHYRSAGHELLADAASLIRDIESKP